jgi:hypothetical protein
LRKSVEVDHRGRNTGLIVPQVIDDIPSDARPRPNSAAPIAQTGIADNPRTDASVASRLQVISKNFVDESFFSLTFKVD